MKTTRRTMTTIIDDLPEDIKREALKHKSPDWDSMPVYSLSRAIQWLREKSENVSEKCFWNNVIRHYESGTPLPFVTDIDDPAAVEYASSKLNFDGLSKMRCVRVAVKHMTGAFSYIHIHKWLIERGAEITYSSVSMSLSKLHHLKQIRRDGNQILDGNAMNLYIKLK